MDIHYKIVDNHILASIRTGFLKSEQVIGQLRYRIKETSEGKTLSIEDIGVNKEYQNKGIGKELSKRVIDHAVNQKCNYIVALAQPEYLKMLIQLGFEADGFFAKLRLK